MITVLYVEDEPSNQMAMQAVFASHTDIDLIDAADDVDAMEYLDEADAPPDVVLMDQGLGHITGAEVRACIVSNCNQLLVTHCCARNAMSQPANARACKVVMLEGTWPNLVAATRL